MVSDLGSLRFPASEVEVSGHTALNTDSVSFTVVGEWATQIVLPAAEDALQQAFGRVVESATPLCMIFNKLLIDCAHALHLKSPSKLAYLLSSGNFWPSDGTKETFLWSAPLLSSSALNCFLKLPRPIS